jgi:hypothetical protein
MFFWGHNFDKCTHLTREICNVKMCVFSKNLQCSFRGVFFTKVLIYRGDSYNVDFWRFPLTTLAKCFWAVQDSSAQNSYFLVIDFHSAADCIFFKVCWKILNKTFRNLWLTIVGTNKWAVWLEFGTQYNCVFLALHNKVLLSP